jgi:threonine dehydrogenase-like Zn-dependent dehydrogenase
VIDDGDLDALLGDAAERPIDVVVETVGGEADTLDTAAMAARPGGTICVLGVFSGSPRFPAIHALMKELRIVSSLCYGRAGARADFDVVLDLLARRGGEIARTLVTHRFPLDALADGFRTAADKTSGSIKVTITV